ncbi:hypothetical protein MPVG_00243 [Micromonas pusilla virus 12T]|mgnify:FL=1|jgi:uncharacterized membrane protein|uniref:hypothetical protein n=1 Tax=Micromonas pusilla virus 12T TaxID=755272 RepID=UPI000105D1CC|nr:hypothetical protein MPVG_00243 [Micromonas pusilla virus 12T]AGH31062.1 hypothetical protein MPVG_00243 [Micromonas pusilla virus 12T]
MLDQGTLRPVIIAMSLYIIVSVLIPRYAKPTNIEAIDDIVAFLVAQRGSIMSGTILMGLLVFSANYLDTEFF